jgi:hypothetical protein
MKKKLTKRSVSLTAPEIEEFFQPPHDHLKYRLTMLLSWKERIERNERFGLQDAICGFEAALVASRLFIQFLGLKTMHDPQIHLVENHDYFDSGGKSDEVKVTDLGGDFVQIAHDLTKDEADLLARTHHGASKATAHLTFGSNHGFDPAELPHAIDVIVRLLKIHLKRPIGRHYD